MIKSALLSLIACVGLIAAVVSAARAGDASRGFAFADKVVLAYYYIWFNENNWIRDGGRRAVARKAWRVCTPWSVPTTPGIPPSSKSTCNR